MFTSLIASWWYALAGFERMATRRILGTVSLSSSSCLATHSRPALPDTPVTFPPGRARLAMSPVPTGSRTAIMTIGIVPVAFLAAVTPCVPHDTMRVTLSRTSSAAKSGSRSTRPSAYRSSMTIFWPSTHPSLAQPLPERVEQGRPIGRGRQAKKTYPRHLSRLLLCTHAHGVRDRTTNKRNELPPPHSTPSSTMTRPGYQMISHANVFGADTREHVLGKFYQHGERNAFIQLQCEDAIRARLLSSILQIFAAMAHLRGHCCVTRSPRGVPFFTFPLWLLMAWMECGPLQLPQPATALTSRYSSRPKRPHSRPLPDCL